MGPCRVFVSPLMAAGTYYQQAIVPVCTRLKRSRASQEQFPRSYSTFKARVGNQDEADGPAVSDGFLTEGVVVGKTHEQKNTPASCTRSKADLILHWSGRPIETGHGLGVQGGWAS